MNNKFSKELSDILTYSCEEARRTSCRNVAPEHMLLGMLRKRESVIHSLLHDMNIDEHNLKANLNGRIHSTFHTQSQPSVSNDVQLDETSTSVLMLSVLEAHRQHAEEISTIHLLLAILHDKRENGAKQELNKLNIDYDTVLNQLTPTSNTPQNSIDLPDEDEEDMEEDKALSSSRGSISAEKTKNKDGASKSKTPVLDNFSYDLTLAAKEGKLDPVVGREHQIERIIEILCRRKKNNPVIIGEPGVGKSAIVEGLAQLIARQNTSPILFNKRLVSLDLTSVVAGTKYRGQFEERIKALIKELEQQPNIIVFIDEIHTMIGAGSTPGSMDAANILKPALARGTIQCIGATTLDEYRNSIEKDGALERRFQKVIVEPTTEGETFDILKNIKAHYEKFHCVHYNEDALHACVALTSRYVTDRAFPDKAIDALDEAGARVRLNNAHQPDGLKELHSELEEARKAKIEAVKNQDYEQAASFRDRQQLIEKEITRLTEDWQNGTGADVPAVEEKDIADVIATMTGVPVQRMEESEGERLRNMGSVLKSIVVAQDAAIDKMTKAIQRNRIGLRDPNHPIGVFMFLGPTGVGKTYLAKKLAEHMFGSADDLIRIDMSEYTESFNTSRLIGAPPGYVGYEEGGQLTERVRHKPYSIVLLDEIEKAHANVYNLLLQVLDEGRLTDGNGRVVDFRNTVIILTSNAGTRQLKEFGRGVGFNTASNQQNHLGEDDKTHARQVVQKALSRQFAPEFLNRLDEIITFDQLDSQAIRRIVDIELNTLFKRMNNMGYNVEVSDEARNFIAEKGYDVQFGARPLKRAIQQYVEDAVCDYLLNNDKDMYNVIRVDKCKDKEEVFIAAAHQDPVTTN